jgi:hypothetical protein
MVHVKVIIRAITSDHHNILASITIQFYQHLYNTSKMSALPRSSISLSAKLRVLNLVRGMSTQALSPMEVTSHMMPPFCHSPAPHASKSFKNTMPPGFRARVGNFDTFMLPSSVTHCAGDEALGRAMIQAWRRDGILQFTMSPHQKRLRDAAFAASKRFFSLPYREKAGCVDDQSYAGYIASGEEITDGIADYSEIFTITKDLPLSDRRVQARWPCHGPCPWATKANMKDPLTAYMEEVGRCGEVLLGLTELGLGLEPGSLTKYTADGWHHSRVLRFPARNNTNGKGKEGRGIGSHTDYGLLVISAQDNVGGKDTPATCSLKAFH